MKHILFLTLAGLVVTTPVLVRAQTNATSGTSSLVSPADREKATVEKRIRPIMAMLRLNDPDKDSKVREILAAHIKAYNAWHTQNDAQIKGLWTEFNQARASKDATNAAANAEAALAKIDGVYASFKPEHDKFNSALSLLLTPAQVESVKDSLTINKVRITYHAYGEIFPGLTDEQNAFILKNLKAAREEAIDAGAMTEKSAFFKKYKIKIEAYLTAQGYDVKKAYQDFIAKQQADMADQKAAPATAVEDKK